MRPIWTGSLSFGLVNIPVKLYLAAKSERFSFRMLHAKDHGPIQFRRFCSLEEKEVPYEEIVRGYEYEKGAFVVVEDADLDRLERAAVRSVDIQQFVDRSQLNPMLLETPYYLEPTRGAERAYALLREALKRSGKLGIARVVLREREYLAAVDVQNGAVVMSTLRYASEIRAAETLNIPGEDAKLPERQLDLALMLVDQLTGDFHPAEYKDDYHERVAEMIRQKLEGLPTPQKAPPHAPAAQVVDLADVLERSLQKARGKPEREAGEEPAQAGSRRAPRTGQRAAARTAHRRKSR